MENERAIEILDPEHREAYESLEPVNEACRMGVEALRRPVPMGNHGEAESHRQVCRGAGCGGLYWDRHRRNAALDKKEKAIQAAPAG